MPSTRSSWRLTPVVLLALLLSLVSTTHAAGAREWRSQSVYQVIVDRFARDDGSTTAPCDTSKQLYCGGSWRGLIQKLDYIQGMGFTAVWISPVVKNFEDTTAYGQGYHGFWSVDLYSLNQHFGTADDLRALSDELHRRGMYLMVDVVANHFAWAGKASQVDYTKFTPLNDKKYFHDFCFISNYSDPVNAEQCWLGDDTVALVDVNTEDPFVQQTFNKWVSDLVQNYGIDGLRIDAAKHVNKPFWQSFTAAAGVFTIGEMFDSNTTWVCDFMVDALTSVLNFPIYDSLIQSFSSPTADIWPLWYAFPNVTDNCTDSTLLGTFAENHDKPRFASVTSDMALAKNVVTFQMLSDGIPMIYNGQEQHLSGGSDPANREAIWLTGYDTTTPLYKHIKILNQVRAQYNKIMKDSTLYTEYWKQKTKLIYADPKRLAMRKGVDAYQIVSIMSSAGSNAPMEDPLTIGDTSFQEDSMLVEVSTCATTKVGRYGTFQVQMKGGIPQTWMAASALVNSNICPDVVRKLNPKCVGTYCGTANSANARTFGSSFLALFGAVFALVMM